MISEKALSSFKDILLKAFCGVRWYHENIIEDYHAFVFYCVQSGRLPACLYLHVSVKGTLLADTRQNGFAEVWQLELVNEEYLIKEVFKDV